MQAIMNDRRCVSDSWSDACTSRYTFADILDFWNMESYFHCRVAISEADQRLPHFSKCSEIVHVRKDERRPLWAVERILQLPAVEYVTRRELRVFYVAGFRNQQAGNVDIVQPQERYDEREAIQFDDHIGGHQVRGSSAESRVMVACVVVPCRLVLAAPQDIRVVFGVTEQQSFCSDTRLEVFQKGEHVHKHIIICLQYELRVGAIIADPLQASDGFVRQSVVRVCEILLYDVSVQAALVVDPVLRTRTTGFRSHHEHDSHGQRVLLRVAPRFSYHQSLLDVRNGGVNVDNEKHVSAANGSGGIEQVVMWVRVDCRQDAFFHDLFQAPGTCDQRITVVWTSSVRCRYNWCRFCRRDGYRRIWCNDRCHIEVKRAQPAPRDESHDADDVNDITTTGVLHNWWNQATRLQQTRFLI